MICSKKWLLNNCELIYVLEWFVYKLFFNSIILNNIHI